MNDNDFVAWIRDAQSKGIGRVFATLAAPCRGVERIAIIIDGHLNGNPHDLWIESRSGKRGLGRAYLGSKRVPQDLEGWPARIAAIES